MLTRKKVNKNVTNQTSFIVLTVEDDTGTLLAKLTMEAPVSLVIDLASLVSLVNPAAFLQSDGSILLNLDERTDWPD